MLLRTLTRPQGASRNDRVPATPQHMEGMTVAGSIPNHKGPLGQKTGPAKKAAPKKAPAKKAPGKAVAKLAKLDTDLTPAKARQITDRIRKSANDVTDSIKAAYLGRVWIPLGHKTWDEWIDANFEDIPLALPREKRKATVATLAQSGLSTRAIAAATGASQSAVARDIKEGLNQNGSVAKDDNVLDIDPKDITEVPENGEAAPPEDQAPEDDRKVIGVDGVERPATGHKTPNVINIVSVARTLAKELEALTVRIGALYDREEYEENKVAVDETLQQAIDDFATEVGDRLPEPEPAPA